MYNKTIFFIIAIVLLIFYQVINSNQENSQVNFMTTNIIFDLYILLTYIYILSKNGIYLFPSSIFIAFFYTYNIMGKYIWTYREENWFNERGSPIEEAIYFSSIGFILCLVSLTSLYTRQKKSKSQTFTTEYYSLFLSKNVLTILALLATIGAFIFTNGFTIIPLLSDSMNESRVLLIAQKSGGRGIGFFLLLSGVMGNSLALFSLNKLRLNNKVYYIGIIIYNTLLLSLYSGRFLPLIPIIIYLIIRTKQIKFTISKMVIYSSGGVLALFMLMYFGAMRQFGNELTNELFVRYAIADLFPEFRMSVYLHELTNKNLFDNFFYTIFAGLFPGSLFSVVGLNKDDLFKPIGGEILSLTQFDASNTPGIRASIFGELSMTGEFVYIFLLLICFILYKVDRSFFKRRNYQFDEYKYLSLAIFLGFSIPYGSLFLISVIEWYILLLIIKKYISNVRNTHFRVYN